MVKMLVNPLERKMNNAVNERKLEFLNNLIYEQTEKWGGQPPEEYYAGICPLVGAYHDRTYRVIGRWKTDNLTEEIMQGLEDLYSAYCFPSKIQGRKTPFGKRANVARYIHFNRKRSNVKKGYLISDFPVKYENEETGIWVTRDFGSRSDAKETPRSKPIRWFYEPGIHSIELREGQIRERSYVELPVQISHILKYGKMIPRDKILYDICRSIALYGVTPHTRKDAGGLNNIIDEVLWRVFAPFKNKEIAQYYGFTPESIILTGVPGVGKTLIASILANIRYDAVFVPVDAWSLVMAQYTESEQKNKEDNTIFDTLEVLKKHIGLNAVLHVDDIEAVLDPEESGKGKGYLAASSELLTRMKGLRESNVPIVGSTNKPWEIDSRFIQFGRFTRIIYVPRPDKSGREEIHRIHSRKRPMETDVDYERLAFQTEGWTGEHIMQFWNEASRLAAMRASDGDFEKLSTLSESEHHNYPIKLQDLAKAYEKTLYGIDLKELNEQDKKIAEFCEKFGKEHKPIGFLSFSRDGHGNGLLRPEDLIIKDDVKSSSDK